MTTKPEQQALPLPKFVRFTNGDDVVTELVELEAPDETLEYLMINPLKLVYIPTNHGASYTIGFMPFVFPRLVEKQEFRVDPSNVLLMAEVSTKIIEHYMESVDEISKIYEESDSPSIEDEEISGTNAESNLMDVLEELSHSGKKTFH